MSDKVDKKTDNVYVVETLESRLLKLKGRSSQELTEFSIDYVLDEENKVLVETGKTNVNDKIQSYASCALDKILDQYLDDVDSGVINNIVVDVDSEAVEGSSFVDKLEDNLQASMHFDALKEKYGLDPALTMEQVIEKLNGYKSKYEDILIKSQASNNKEVSQDEEKTIEQESKQEEF